MMPKSPQSDAITACMGVWFYYVEIQTVPICGKLPSRLIFKRGIPTGLHPQPHGRGQNKEG